jgi:predicted NUDIX family NTP pyrophosphohydrolase
MSYSAGVLPFTIKNGTVYFLLGRDRADGAFSDFGGKAECVDEDDPKRTAVREFYEETAGSVLDLDACAARLQEGACHDVVVSRTMGGNVYRMYIIYIPFLSSYPRSFERTMRFLRYMKANRKFLEKTELAWFSLESLMAAVRVPDSCRRTRLRGPPCSGTCSRVACGSPRASSTTCSASSATQSTSLTRSRLWWRHKKASGLEWATA